MDEIKFEESMQAARSTNKEIQTEASTTLLGQTDPTPTRIQDKIRDLSGKPETAIFFLIFFCK